MKRLPLIALFAALAGPAVAAAPRVDIVIRGGTIYNGANAEPITGDVEIAGDRIVYVGPTRRTQAAQIIDAKGQIVAPGLIDAHMHSVAYADSLTNLDLSGSRSLDEAVAAIRERAQTLPVGSWVVGAGWDLNRWDDPRYPDRQLLDREVPDHPVAMWSIDLHTVWANGSALVIAGIDDDTRR